MSDAAPAMNDFNRQIIEEFRANAGKVGGGFAGAPMVLLTTTGAKTGNRHTTPVVHGTDGDRIFVVASKAGAPRHPAWFHNLRVNPSVTVELGERTFEAQAVVTTGEERDRLYRRVAGEGNEYEKNTDRVFPVVVLNGVPAPA